MCEWRVYYDSVKGKEYVDTFCGENILHVPEDGLNGLDCPYCGEEIVRIDEEWED